MSATVRISGVVTKIEPIKNLIVKNKEDAAVVNFKIKCASGKFWDCSIYRDGNTTDNLKDFLRHIHVDDEICVDGRLLQSSWFDKEVKRQFTKYYTVIEEYECLTNNKVEQVTLVL